MRLGVKGTALFALCLSALLGCGSSPGAGDPPCTAIGSPAAISLDISPETAPAISAATPPPTGQLTACWGGECRTAQLDLRAATSAGATTCVDENCSAQMTPTGGLAGFVELPDLPKDTPVAVTLALGGAEHRVEVVPRATFPNGPECGEGGPQARLTLNQGGLSAG
ncbi:hypothetical protein [Actinokineospora iranica]|uniref:Uncharacterized protein n=1 Tax=Actinokineospora iranica TaxID=1271860 RepID=A0A1G6LLU0_9PSEU|nr:hypothetical protein [Actinokineospora iranica]SDC44084.1 hypothetical protein SAMN05216174_102135 [Actinokineospora iranica]